MLSNVQDEFQIMSSKQININIDPSETEQKFRCLIANDDQSQLFIKKYMFLQNNFDVTCA